MLARPSLGACLGLAFLAVLGVLAAGMRLAQQSTGETVELVGSVESQYEPVLRASREVAEAVSAFERVVVDWTQIGSADDPESSRLSEMQLFSALDKYTGYAVNTPGIPRVELRARLEVYRNQGLAIEDLCRKRGAEIQKSLVALDGLVARAYHASVGFESGDQIVARKSLAELSRSAAILRASMRMLAAAPSPASARTVAGDEAAFAALLGTHSTEFTRAPGRAWLELMQQDFAAASRGRAQFLETEQNIETMRTAFAQTARELATLVESDLQKPAWQALTRAAGRARVAAQNTEIHLTRVTVGILSVVLIIAGIIIYGIAAPVRRLLEGTRRLARGALDARVGRGGVRELDELAVAFNDMAEALDTSQQSLREHQAALEERIAKRTEDLRHLANHDPLTDLPNRRELVARLAAAVGRARSSTTSCAVLYMDIDNFKTINDSLGHQFGDRVLREIGARLQKVAGKGGFLARLGGDEFTLVVEDIESAAAAESYVGEIMRAFSKPLRVGDRELLVSLSIGIAMYPEHGETTEALLRAADSALYDAKDRGRNGFSLYRAELLSVASHRFNTEQGLRRALENGDFLLYFQPEVSLVEKRTTVIEALLRWRQPDGRIAAAGEFIDIAEKSGLILELSDWVLRRAVEAARELRAGVWPQARVAINVSAQQFLTGQFVESVERTLREAKMPADCLEIELTESALQTGRLAVGALHELRRLGVAVALDDFGAGFSSLKSIGELPLTRVKLDRSLIHDIESNTSAAAIAHSFVQLCQRLGLTVTAEGIERPGQLDFLASCGDVQVQGYLIARAAPLDEIAQFIPETPLRVASVWPKAAAWQREIPASREAAPVTFLRPRVG